MEAKVRVRSSGNSEFNRDGGRHAFRRASHAGSTGNAEPPDNDHRETASLTFSGSFTQQEAIPDEAIDAAVEVMRSGRLHRYNVVANELSETALLEKEFAAMAGRRFCLAVCTGGYAITCALRALDLLPGETVLTNAFTLAPVPGAIVAAGGLPALVESDEDLRIDLDDLQGKMERASARILVLSHMRGHICDMDRLMELCDRSGVTVVEDCAHTMGAAWSDTWSGNHGCVACYSTQTYKHVNSGEGGLLTTDDADLMAKAIVLSGSYMLFGRHAAAPAAAEFGAIPYGYPNCSGRMDNLRAAILRPQLRRLERNCAEWLLRYRTVEQGLELIDAVQTIPRSQREAFVGSSIQFRLPGFSSAMVSRVVRDASARGVELKWFGSEQAEGYTSRSDHWRYIPERDCPKTKDALSCLLDMRLPLTFSIADCRTIVAIVRDVVNRTAG